MQSSSPNAHGAYANLPGVRLWYLDSGGDGEVIMLLHPTAGTSESWQSQIAAFSKAGYRVIAPDRRGWGRSIPDANGPQPGISAEDLQAFADFLKLKKFHLMATGGGGLIALDYAAWRSDRLHSLVIGSCIASRSEKEINDFSQRIALPKNIKVPRVCQDVSASYRGANPEGTARWVEIEEKARQPGASPVTLRSPNSYQKLATITAPLLIMAGTADTVAPPTLMRIWAPYVRNSKFVVVPDAGHSLAWEQPEFFNQEVLKFIGTT